MKKASHNGSADGLQGTALARKCREWCCTLQMLVTVSVLFAASPAFAFSYLSIADGDLFERADAVVGGRIEAPPETARGASVYRLAVDEVYRGAVYGNRVLVSVPGTPPGNGDSGVVVSGAPRFKAGERVLLFLRDRGNGFVLQDLALGVFHEQANSEGRTVLIRDLHSARRLGASDDAAFNPESGGLVRDAEGFRAWLRSRARGIEVADEYWRLASGEPAEIAKYTLEGSPPVRRSAGLNSIPVAASSCMPITPGCSDCLVAAMPRSGMP